MLDNKLACPILLRMDACAAAEFVATLEYPVLRFASVGKPAGEDFALLEGCELPFDLNGEVKDGREWDGDGEPVDFGRCTVYAVWICDDREEYERQERVYNASI